MGIWDKVKGAASTVKAEAVIAKANADSRKTGYDPNDYAGFNGEGKQPETDNDEN